MAVFSRRRRFGKRLLQSEVRNVVFGFVGLLLIFSGIGFGVWGTKVAVAHGVTVKGNEVVPTDEVVASVRESIEAPVLGPLPGNLLFFPKKRVLRTLSDIFPRFADIRVSRDFIHRQVSVSVRERTAEGIYCVGQEAPAPSDGLPLLGPAITTGSCFLIDRDGVIFAEAPQSEGSLILSLVDTRGGDKALGQQAIAPDIFVNIKDLWDAFRSEIRVGVRRVVFRNGNLLEAETFEGWRAIFDFKQDPHAQLIALRELLAKDLPEPQRRSISYIDLRIPGRIYYQ